MKGNKKQMKTYKEIQREQLLFEVEGENKINSVLNYAMPLLLEEFKRKKWERILNEINEIVKKGQIKQKIEVFKRS